MHTTMTNEQIRGVNDRYVNEQYTGRENLRRVHVRCTNCVFKPCRNIVSKKMASFGPDDSFRRFSSKNQLGPHTFDENTQCNGNGEKPSLINKHTRVFARVLVGRLATGTWVI